MAAGAGEGILAQRLEGLNDPEGERLPLSLPESTELPVPAIFTSPDESLDTS